MIPVDMSAPLPAIQLDGETWEALIEMRVGPPRTMTLEHLVQVLAALPTEQRREVIGQALGITGFGGFECDPSRPDEFACRWYHPSAYSYS